MSYIYAFEGFGGLIKLGWSEAPWRRLRELQTGVPHVLVPLGIIPALECQEQELHRLLAAWQETGEWFRRCRAIEYLLSKMRPWPWPNSSKLRIVPPSSIETVTDLIVALGGPTAMAFLFGTTPQCVVNWRAAGKIPANLYKLHRKKLSASRKELTVSDDPWGFAE